MDTAMNREPENRQPRLYSCDIIGNIAIIDLHGREELNAREIAGDILRKRRKIRTVLEKISQVSGSRRVARYRLVSGDSSVTVHREFGIPFWLDPREVFFNPRLASERNRVTRQVSPGESVLVPFSGFGPFVIPAAIRGATVCAIDTNPLAVRWLTENICRHHLGDRVSVVLGDAFDAGIYPDSLFDRAIIPTPYGKDHALDIIAPRVRQGGILHWYTFKKDHEIPSLVAQLPNRSLIPVRIRKCGNVAPGVRRFVADLVRG